MTILSILFLVALGILFADFMAGVVHWLLDNHLSENTWIIGHAVTDNRMHHAQPMFFLSKTFVQRNMGATLSALAAATLFIVLGASWWFIVPAFVTGALANEIHAYTHRLRRPKWVKFLQFTRLMQPPAQHGGHHKRPLTNYCPVTGYLNPLLTRIGLWDKLDRIMVKLKRFLAKFKRK